MELQIRSRLYSTVGLRPMQVTVRARCANRTRHATRYPFAESVFEDAAVQPYIHNCIVKVHEGCNMYRFMIFFKRHCNLRLNKTLSTLSTRCLFRGDIVVMRVAARNEFSVVNMRERDTILADWVIPRLVQRLLQVFSSSHISYITGLQTRLICAATYQSC